MFNVKLPNPSLKTIEVNITQFESTKKLCLKFSLFSGSPLWICFFVPCDIKIEQNVCKFHSVPLTYSFCIQVFHFITKIVRVKPSITSHTNGMHQIVLALEFPPALPTYIITLSGCRGDGLDLTIVMHYFSPKTAGARF